jgi:taurine dioxygenase
MPDYQHIVVEPLTPIIGAEVSGVDLANLDEAQWEELMTAWHDRLVLVFRDQQLSREQHKDFGRRFGELHLHPAKTHLGMAGDPEIFDINITAQTKVANGEAWHTDLSCEPVPPMASALYITEVPESGGGDTLFANMYEALTSLSEPMQQLLEGLSAFHDGRKDLAAYGYQLSSGQSYPAANHPVVIRHPDTGRKLLFVNEPFTVRINELSQSESDALLQLLYRHIEVNTRCHCRVRWQPNTLVLWDNRAAHHHAVWDYYPETRRGERVTMAGSGPPQGVGPERYPLRIGRGNE